VIDRGDAVEVPILLGVTAGIACGTVTSGGPGRACVYLSRGLGVDCLNGADAVGDRYQVTLAGVDSEWSALP
jgi:hypothetical protein